MKKIMKNFVCMFLCVIMAVSIIQIPEKLLVKLLKVSSCIDIWMQKQKNMVM